MSQDTINKIVECLNSVCGTSYKPTTKATQRHIKARLAEGFTLDDFRSVICFKSDQWRNDDRMMEYLRPDTLFGTKFESYLQAANMAARPAPVRKAPEVAL